MSAVLPRKHRQFAVSSPRTARLRGAASVSGKPLGPSGAEALCHTVPVPRAGLLHRLAFASMASLPSPCFAVLLLPQHSQFKLLYLSFCPLGSQASNNCSPGLVLHLKLNLLILWEMLGNCFVTNPKNDKLAFIFNVLPCVLLKNGEVSDCLDILY